MYRAEASALGADGGSPARPGVAGVLPASLWAEARFTDRLVLHRRAW